MSWFLYDPEIKYRVSPVLNDIGQLNALWREGLVVKYARPNEVIPLERPPLRDGPEPEPESRSEGWRRRALEQLFTSQAFRDNPIFLDEMVAKPEYMSGKKAFLRAARRAYDSRS